MDPTIEIEIEPCLRNQDGSMHIALTPKDEQFLRSCHISCGYVAREYRHILLDREDRSSIVRMPGAGAKVFLLYSIAQMFDRGGARLTRDQYADILEEISLTLDEVDERRALAAIAREVSAMREPHPHGRWMVQVSSIEALYRRVVPDAFRTCGGV
jgi:hypothetical protein